MPLLGSGPDTCRSGSGFFSVEEYREILRYATQRHIEVIPEIDMPGHCHAAVQAMQVLFIGLAGVFFFFLYCFINPMQEIQDTVHGHPRRLAFTWWGCCRSCLWHKPAELVHTFVFCSCVFMALSTVFHSINSPDNSLLSHSVLWVLFLPCWAFHR